MLLDNSVKQPEVDSELFLGLSQKPCSEKIRRDGYMFCFVFFFPKITNKH